MYFQIKNRLPAKSGDGKTRTHPKKCILAYASSHLSEKYISEFFPHADRLSDYHGNDGCDGFSPHFPCFL